MTKLHRALLCLSPALLLGCEAPPERAIVGPDATFSANSRQVVQSASGSGHITVNDGWRTFSFTAQRRANGEIHGRYQLNNRGIGAQQRGSVTCLIIVGNEAIIAGPTDADPSVGHVFRVRDNGEGSNTPPDQITLAGIAATEAVEAECNNQGWNVAFFPIEAGNVQVRD